MHTCIFIQIGMVEAVWKTRDNRVLVGHVLIMTSYLLILISTVFVNNIVLVKILGLCPFMGVSKKLEAAISMGI